MLISVSENLCSWSLNSKQIPFLVFLIRVYVCLCVCILIMYVQCVSLCTHIMFVHGYPYVCVSLYICYICAGYPYVCVSVYVYFICAGACRGERRAWDVLELE